MYPQCIRVYILWIYVVDAFMCCGHQLWVTSADDMVIVIHNICYVVGQRGYVVDEKLTLWITRCPQHRQCYPQHAFTMHGVVSTTCVDPYVVGTRCGSPETCCGLSVVNDVVDTEACVVDAETCIVDNTY